MGLANWVVGRMVDKFLAQPPEEKAAMVDTMATKFWAAATPEETARIAELLMPRFLETFLNGATTEQKLELMRGMITPEHLQRYVGELMPAMLKTAMDGATPEQRQELMQSMLDRDQLAGMLETMMPGLLETAIQNVSPEQSAQLMQSMLDREQLGSMLSEMLPSLLQGAVQSMPQAAMQKFLSAVLPGFGPKGSSAPRRDDERPQPPRGPGGMMPW